MRLILSSAALLVAVAVTSATSPPTVPGAMQADLQWGPAPAAFPRGAEMVVMHGDPSGSGPFTIRLRLPDGYRIPPHTHPSDEHITVISGGFFAGMGDKLDPAKLTMLPPGGFGIMPAKMNHFAMTKAETVIELTAIGPFQMTYVNPQDDPTKTTTSQPGNR